MSDDVILCEVADGVATVTLNRPQAMNALNRAMRKRLAEVMRAVDADENVRAVILTGAGTRAFTAGLDLKELGCEEGALGLSAVPMRPTLPTIRSRPSSCAASP
jgi:enoyl-CoA hydratase